MQLAAIAVAILAATALAGAPSPARAQVPPSSGPIPEYAVEHVIFGKTQLDLFTTGLWASYVHEGDSFMLMSGNNSGEINCQALNAWAKMVRERHPSAPIYAATSGINNVTNGAPCLDKTLFSGMTLVYEPNQRNAPEFSWDRAETEELLAYAAGIIRQNGLQAWTKISGRAAGGRDMAGQWDYGVMGTLLDGQIVQTQGSCRDVNQDGDFVNGEGEFRAAIQSISDMYAGAATTAPLHIRVTTSSEETNINTVTAAEARQCAEAAWAQPGVARVTLRTAVGDQESLDLGTTFYQLREFLLREGSSAGFAGAPVATSVTTPAEPGATGESSGMPAPGAISGELPASGLGFIVWGGGMVDELLTRATESACAAESVWLVEAGEFFGYIVGAPEAVNGSFLGQFSGGDLPSAPVLVRCGGGV